MTAACPRQTGHVDERMKCTIVPPGASGMPSVATPSASRSRRAGNADPTAGVVVLASVMISLRARAELFARIHERGHHGIRPAHLPVFAGLKAGLTRASELAAAAGVTRQAMSLLVRDVEQAGYIASEPDPDDARAARIRLTPSGEQFCRDAAAGSREVTRALADELGAPAIEALLTTAKRIAGGTAHSL